MDEKFYTVDQLAEMLGFNRTTIIALIRKRQLGASVWGKQYRISESQLKEYMDRNSIKPQ